MLRVYVCTNCGEQFLMDDKYVNDNTYNGNIYCEGCFSELFTRCEDCNKIIYKDASYYIEKYDRIVCDCCFNDNYVQCIECGTIISRNDVYTGCDDNWYCEDCFYELFRRCEDCNKIIYKDASYYDDAGYCYCQYCYTQHIIIKPYHSEYMKYNPKYMDDDDRNDNYLQLYGLELEITGSTDTARELLDIMGDDVVLMQDSSVSGYEMITMPLSRKYFYKAFVPKLTKGLRYLIDNGMTGHNGGGIHIHFKEQTPVQVANIVNMLYTNDEDTPEFEIWKKISQRSIDSIKLWCNNVMTDYSYTPDEILSSDRKSTTSYDRHSTALNYDTRTKTHELRIFNSNLRIERVIKNMECLFAIEDYVKDKQSIVCTLEGFLKYVNRNTDKYPYFGQFLFEKEIFDYASKAYNTVFTNNKTTEVYTVCV